MNLEKFTDRAKGFLQSAQTIAIRMNHQRIGSEHILKALLEDNEGMASGLITRAGGNPRIAVDEVDAVRVDEIREARRAADARDGHDLLMRDLQVFERLVESGEDGEVAAAGAPSRVVGGERFFRELFLGGGRGGGDHGNQIVEVGNGWRMQRGFRAFG